MTNTSQGGLRLHVEPITGLAEPAASSGMEACFARCGTACAGRRGACACVGPRGILHRWGYLCLLVVCTHSKEVATAQPHPLFSRAPLVGACQSWSGRSPQSLPGKQVRAPRLLKHCRDREGRRGREGQRRWSLTQGVRQIAAFQGRHARRCGRVSQTCHGGTSTACSRKFQQPRLQHDRRAGRGT